MRKFARRVSPAPAPSPSDIVLGGQAGPPVLRPPFPSDPETFFSDTTLTHALEQLGLLLRDIVVGLPAFALAAASLVRLPSLIANITSACITRQVLRPFPHLRLCFSHGLT